MTVSGPYTQGLQFIRSWLSVWTSGWLLGLSQRIHIILDDYSTHKHPVVKRWLARHPHFELHFIPTGSSWMNLVE